MKRVRWLQIGTCLVAVLALAACRPTDPREVVVYVAVDRQHAEPILRDFERESGRRVLAVYDTEAAKTTGLVTRLLAESSQPQCDLFWNNELVQSLLLQERGLLAPAAGEWAQEVPARWRSGTGEWTGLAVRARVIVYNSRLVKAEEAPRSIFELADPRWKGKCAIANPQFGTTRTHIAALYAALGPERTQQFLQGLLANDVRIVDGNAMVKNLVGRASPDASPILVGLTDTDDVLAGQQEGYPLAMVFPDQETFGACPLLSTVCPVRDGPHPDGARELLAFLVSPAVERRFVETAPGYAGVRNVAESPLLGNVRWMEVDPDELRRQLLPSSRWTDEHFR